MLKPKELQNLPKGLTDIYSELSEFVLRDIARRIAKAAEITDTAEYQLYRARALGLSTKEITQKIAKINGVAETEIEKIIREAAEKSDEFDRKMLGADDGAAVPLSENEQLQIMMAAEIDNTHGLCRNYTRTLGFAEVNAQGQVVYSSMTDFLRKQMDMAHMKVASGVTDYNTAIRQACRALSESGLRTVYYESGRSDRIEVAVRRALMTSVSQVTQRISEQNAEEFGADGWEISAHSGARPSHAVYQGRQFPNSKYELIVRPLIEDYNCRHSAFPIIMGVSQPAYTEEELKNIDPPPFTYEGRTYTAYQAQQQMRKMERSMRKQKDRCIVADAAGNKDTFTAASIKLRRQKDIYEDFCKAAGTYTEYERTFVQGYDRHLAAKTGAVTRAQNRQKNLQITLTDMEKGGIIKAGSDGMERKKDNTKIEPMPKKQFRKIERAFKQQGGIIICNEESERFLEAQNSEGSTLDAKTIILRRNPGRAAVYEEMIHAAQYRRGENDGSHLSRVLNEIAAQKILLKNAKAYGLTKNEIEQTQRALASYEAELETLKITN